MPQFTKQIRNCKHPVLVMGANLLCEEDVTYANTEALRHAPTSAGGAIHLASTGGSHKQE